MTLKLFTCWVGYPSVDRAVKAVEQFGLPGDVKRWRTLCREIHDEVCSQGFSPDVNSFVQYYGSTEPDASLLMLPLVGFLPPTDARMLGTVAFVEKTLLHDGMVRRYRTRPELDGLPPGEGAFLLCTFWLADNLALQGRHSEAREIFDRLLSIRNDVGLLPEQWDCDNHRFLGNFPQAFSHVGLINTARNLAMSGGPAEHRRKESDSG